MLVFFQCVAEAVATKGVRGLLVQVPGVGFLADVATEAWQLYRARRSDTEIREDVRRMAAAGTEEAKRAAAEAARRAIASPGEQAALETFLTVIPAQTRRSLKRPDDPSGKTVPPQFRMTGPDDLARLLPARPPVFAPGTALPGRPDWHVAELLGVGGFGEVWLARHSRTPALTGAVKVCTALAAGDRDLLHEGKVVEQVMAGGRHPHIVPLVDMFLEGATPWLMYEYVPGGDLADRVREWQALPQRDRVLNAINGLRDLAKAVAHFHRLSPPVVHRDLKPANVLCDPHTGALRVTDFGIGAVAARAALAADNPLTRSGRLLTALHGSHTPLYASPQQRDGAPPTPGDDIYALGVIGMQMFTGLLDQGAGADFAEDLREAGCPEPLAALLARCVAQRADRRLGRVEELLEGLTARPAAAEKAKPTPTRGAAPAPAVAPTPQTGTVLIQLENATGFIGRKARIAIDGVHRQTIEVGDIAHLTVPSGERVITATLFEGGRVIDWEVKHTQRVAPGCEYKLTICSSDAENQTPTPTKRLGCMGLMLRVVLWIAVGLSILFIASIIVAIIWNLMR